MPCCLFGNFNVFMFDEDFDEFYKRGIKEFFSVRQFPQIKRLEILLYDLCKKGIFGATALDHYRSFRASSACPSRDLGDLMKRPLRSPEIRKIKDSVRI